MNLRGFTFEKLINIKNTGTKMEESFSSTLSN